MSLLTPSWHKLAGFAKWITCRKVPSAIATDRLAVCRRCPTAQLRKGLGWYFLTCGEPGEDRMDAREPSCGCGLGLVPRRLTAKIDGIADPQARKAVALRQLRPGGKSRCRGEACPQRRWESH